MASVESVPAYLHPGVSVSQPPHLEGDPSLATEILPGPPPLGSIQQVGLPRKDHKKTSIALSYLPASDPGTTYPNHLASILPAAPTDMDGSRRKRARLDKGCVVRLLAYIHRDTHPKPGHFPWYTEPLLFRFIGTALAFPRAHVSSSERNRSQRASARNLSAAGPMSDPITAPEIAASSSQLPPDYDPLSLPLDSDDAIMSRATTAHAEDSPPESAPPVKRGRGRPMKENGKGKERERDPVVKVKEEPTIVSLSSEVVPSLSNEDHCSACRSFGSLVYCDGCPRAFHLWCLDPPMESADLPEGERWFCPACVLEQRPPPKPPASLKFMTPLVHELSSRIPSEFQLPQELRTFFRDVGSSIRGSYLDTSEVKQARLNRHGQLEDRDPYRLKDRNGDPVLCFQCGTSALPPDLAADSPTAKRARRATSSGSSNYSSGRAIISCDYCQLHCHLDCLNPPLVFMPPWNKKWMCPNHAERILLPKRRIPRANATPIEITKPRQWNNGIIEITSTEAAPAPVVAPPKLNVDEVLINGRRYRVPERIITLDFWEKISKNQGGYSEASREVEDSSRMSSPLTSLSSLDDESIPPLSISADSSLYTRDDVRFAELLCGLRLQNHSSASEGQTGSNSSSLPRETQQANAATSQTRIKREYGAPNGDTNELSLAAVSPAVEGPSLVRPTRPRRTAASRTPAPARNRSRAARHAGRSTDEVPMDVDLPELVFSSGKRPDARRKAARPPETSEGATKIAEPTVDATDTTPRAAEAPAAVDSISASSAPKRKRSRTSRRRTSPTPAASADTPVADSGRHARSHSKHEASTSSQSGKRKANGVNEGGSSTSRGHAKPVTPPTANGPAASATIVERKPDATPTLKIRLPRLSALHSPSLIPPAPVADVAPKASPAKAAVAASTSSRPRRSLRRQASIPTSMNSATTSDASSSARVNETGLAASPIESF